MRAVGKGYVRDGGEWRKAMAEVGGDYKPSELPKLMFSPWKMCE